MYIKHLILTALLSALSLSASALTPDTCAALDCRVYHLPNGVRVMAKQTAYKPRTVVVRGSSPGGLSMQYTLANAAAMLLMEDFVGILGCDGYSADDLRKLAKEEKIRTSVKIDKAEEVVELSVPTALMDRGMELICRRVTAPRVSQEAFDAWQQRRMTTANRQHSAAIQIMGDSILRNVYNHHPLAGKATTDDVSAVTLDGMMAIYADRFADMGDFTFYICGDFKWDALEQVISSRLGALPTGQRAVNREKPREIGFGYPALSHTVEFSSDTHAPLAVSYRFAHADMELSPYTYAAAKLLGNIVIKRLNTVLKEERGAASFIQGHCSVIYPENGSDGTLLLFPIYVRTTPERLAEVEEYVMGVLTEIATDGPQPDEYSAAVRQYSDYTAQALADNGYWLEVMAHYDRHGLNYAAPTPDPTADALRAMAARVLAAPTVAITMNRPAEK